MRALAVLVALVAFALLAPAPVLAADSLPMSRMLLQTGWALLVVVGLILAIYGIARRRLVPGRSSGNLIRVVEMRPLLPRTTLALVEVRGHEYLLAVSPTGTTCLALVSGAADPIAPDFKAVLAEQPT